MQVLTRPWLPYAYVAVVLVLLGTHWAAYTHGRRVLSGEVAARDLAAAQDAAESRREAQRLASTAAARLESTRSAISRAQRAPRKALDAALNTPPTACPATAGDAVIPADVWVRLQALDDAARSAEPGAAE